MATSAGNAPDSPVKRALFSVSDKSGLVDFARALVARDVVLLSTGGTAAALRAVDLPVIDVAQATGFPEMLDGRVKTLHPMVHGGILARRDDQAHVEALAAHGIDAIDLVVVNLYPFAATVAAGNDANTCIENIDVGGPSLIRGAAKNHDFVTVVTDPADYQAVSDELERGRGATGLELRRRLAAKAFAHSSAYDADIAAWFAQQSGEPFAETHVVGGRLKQRMSYGENPHQRAALYTTGVQRPGVAGAAQLQGKALSFNNIRDADAALELVAEFDRPAVAIIKHANPCGVALGDDLEAAYRKALACDPMSAFGGVVAANRELDAATAQAIIAMRTDVAIAPAANEAARQLLAERKNLRLLVTGAMPDPTAPRIEMSTIAGGFLLQEGDGGRVTAAGLRSVTQRSPSDAEIADLLFAWRVCKHVRSNAIVFANGGATVGIGAGQMSRVDSVRVGAWKAREAARAAGETGSRTAGSVAASDAFFPFADGMLAALDAGATAVIQPGGAMRDAEVIAAADDRGAAMVFTWMRHFRH